MWSIINYFRYRNWLKLSLEESALAVMDHALRESEEHEFLDFKRDFFINREFQKDKTKSEELTKIAISGLLERYAVAFANRYGGYLIVGVAQEKRSFWLHGINYKNIRRKKLIGFLQQEMSRIEIELDIKCSFISLRVKQREVFIFQVQEGKKKPHVNTSGQFIVRKKDQALDLTKYLKKSPRKS
jgi:predicted HTH transcriptional regulator